MRGTFFFSHEEIQKLFNGSHVMDKVSDVLLIPFRDYPELQVGDRTTIVIHDLLLIRFMIESRYWDIEDRRGWILGGAIEPHSIKDNHVRFLKRFWNKRRRKGLEAIGNVSLLG